MDLMLQIPPFAELSIMKYTPSVSTKKEFNCWYWSVDVANIVICIDGRVDVHRIIAFCVKLYILFGTKIIFVG